MNMKSRILSLVFLIVLYSCEKNESTSIPSSCDSIKQGLLKPNLQDTLRLLSCIKITGCDSIRIGLLKPKSQDTLRLLSCIKISGCDSIRLGFSKSQQDLIRLNCGNSIVIIGTQQWMQKNLEVTKYRNGDDIAYEPDAKKWSQLTTGAWCYYNNDPANGTTYGKLYNWYAVNDPRGLAPLGWRIPNNDEWRALSVFLGASTLIDTVGGKMKTIGSVHWKIPNTGATNASGFSGLPGGAVNPEGSGSLNLGSDAYWWSASQSSTSNTIAFFSQLKHSDKNFYVNSSASKKWGFSVRCVKE
jgi:uncharacterized protein (TIGR02145 family)